MERKRTFELEGKTYSIYNHSKGYDMIWKDGKNQYLHRVIATHFIPNPDNLPHVNHKNGNKKDNRVENLEWVTPQQNYDHAIENKLGVPARRFDKEIVSQIIELGKQGLSTRKLGKLFNCDNVLIYRILKKKTYKNVQL
jgi:hypothetical protein